MDPSTSSSSILGRWAEISRTKQVRYARPGPTGLLQPVRPHVSSSTPLDNTSEELSRSSSFPFCLSSLSLYLSNGGPRV